MKKHFLVVFAVSLVGLFMICAFTQAQEKSDEALKKKYAPILGDYVFDWNGRTFTLSIYVEGEALRADSGDGRPITMEPSGENAFEFTAEDQINGMFEFKFIKDDQSEYSVCQLVNPGMGWDLKGTKKGDRS